MHPCVPPQHRQHRARDRSGPAADRDLGAQPRARRGIPRRDHRRRSAFGAARQARGGVVVRHGIRGAAQARRRRGPLAAGAVPRHRLAVSRNARLPRHAGGAARPHRCAHHQAGKQRGCGARSRCRPVVARSRRLLQPAQGRAACSRAFRVRRLDQRPQTLPGRQPQRAAAGRGRRLKVEVQSARASEPGRVGGRVRRGGPAAPSARASRLHISGLHAVHRVQARRARDRAPAAGAAAARPSAGFISARCRLPSRRSFFSKTCLLPWRGR